MKDHLKLGCAVVALIAAASGAHAESDVAASAAPQDTAGGTGARTATGDIVVTARRRAESTLNVPIAVTAVSDKALQDQRILSTLDIGITTPGLTAANASSGGRDVVNFSIRGQGTQYDEPNAVLVYSDEAILGGGGATNGVQAGPIYDLSSVQVLKGPQGTLFGATSTGGAVLYTTKRASTRGFEGYGQFDGGNLGYRQFQGALNVPLANWAAVRVATDIVHRNGFTTWDNVPDRPKLDGEQSQSFRVSLHLASAAGITNDTIYEYYHYHDSGQSMIGLAYNAQILCGTTDPSSACVQNINRVVANQDPRHVTQADLTKTLTFTGTNAGLSNDYYDHNAQTNRIVNLTNAELGGGITLRNIISYSDSKIYPHSGGGANGSGGLNYGGSDPIVGVPGVSYYAVVYNADAKQSRPYYITEEAQLQAQLNRYAHLTLGGYYEWDRNYVAETALIVGSGFYYSVGAPLGPSAYRNKAVFGQADVDGGWIGLDRLSLSFGARQSYFDNIANEGTASKATSSSKGFTYNVSLNYKPSNGVLIYLAHRKGLKPGGTNTLIFALSPSVADFYRNFGPETVKDVELGVKAKFRTGGWSGSVEAAGYYQWYSNIQGEQTDAAADSFAGNFGSGRVKGVEFSATIRPPIDGLELSGYFSYVDPTYTKFLLPDLQSCLAINCSIGQLTFIDASGSAYSHVSKTTWQVHASYDLPILPRDRGVVTLSGTYFYQSGYPGNPTSVGIPPQFQLSPATRLIKARLDWRGVLGSNFDVGIFADNIANRVNTASFDMTSYNNQGVARISYAEPRTYGVTMRYHFGGSD